MKIPFLSKKQSAPVPEKIPAAKPAPDAKKTYLLIGLACIVGAFLGVCAIFYMMTHESMQKEEKIRDLNDQLVTVNAEKEIVEAEVENLKTQVDTIKIETIVAQSQKMYGQDENSRKEGLLWVDRKTKMYIVTLGALNGLKSGSSLTVYDGENKIGEATVDMPLDVISYVEASKKASEIRQKN